MRLKTFFKRVHFFPRMTPRFNLSQYLQYCVVEVREKNKMIKKWRKMHYIYIYIIIM